MNRPDIAAVVLAWCAGLMVVYELACLRFGLVDGRVWRILLLATFASGSTITGGMWWLR